MHRKGYSQHEDEEPGGHIACYEGHETRRAQLILVHLETRKHQDRAQNGHAKGGSCTHTWQSRQ